MPIDNPTPEFSNGVAPDESNAPAPVEEDFVFVTYPDGSLHAIPRAQVAAANASAGLPANETVPQKKVTEEFYVHLADGSVNRVNGADLPVPAGTNAPNGYYIADGFAHYVIGVYPVESKHTDS